MYFSIHKLPCVEKVSATVASGVGEIRLIRKLGVFDFEKT